MSILSPAAAGGPAPAPARLRLHPLHVHISVLFTLLILVSGAILGWHNYRQTSKVMLSASDDLFERIGRETVLEIARIYAPIELLTDFVKKGKTLSESIRIMSFMKNDRHIDPELFDLFLSSGVYLDYARRYMRPEQIDAVDIRQYLSAAA